MPTTTSNSSLYAISFEVNDEIKIKFEDSSGLDKLKLLEVNSKLGRVQTVLKKLILGFINL